MSTEAEQQAIFWKERFDTLNDMIHCFMPILLPLNASRTLTEIAELSNVPAATWKPILEALNNGGYTFEQEGRHGWSKLAPSIPDLLSLWNPSK